MGSTFKEKAVKERERFDREWPWIYDDGMIRSLRPAVLLVVIASSWGCASTKPAAIETPAEPAGSATVRTLEAPPQTQAADNQPFDPSTVTQEVKKATFSDAQALVEKLNAIIRARDFAAWETYLTPAYIAYYSDPVVLARLSESPVLSREGIVLKSLNDYFLRVVYQSRQNARLDDIEFVGQNSIIAITISPRGDRLVLYNLERQNDSWKIGIGRQ